MSASRGRRTAPPAELAAELPAKRFPGESTESAAVYARRSYAEPND